MWTKILLIATAVLLLAQNISSVTEDEAKKVRSYVNIDGNLYFIDLQNQYHRDIAKDMCESLNMTLVRFETEEKWNSIFDYVRDNSFGLDWFWTGALRDINDTRWYWEATGADITEFYWGIDQPVMDGLLIRACIGFNYQVTAGWEDTPCFDHYYNYICE